MRQKDSYRDSEKLKYLANKDPHRPKPLEHSANDRRKEEQPTGKEDASLSTDSSLSHDPHDPSHPRNRKAVWADDNSSNESVSSLSHDPHDPSHPRNKE